MSDVEIPVIKRPSSSTSTYDMVIAAITFLCEQEKKGASVQAIKHYILDNNPTVDPSQLKNRLKKALTKAMDVGLVIRPKSKNEGSDAIGGKCKSEMHF